MSLIIWITLFLITSLWWKWIISWGGATWLMGIKAWFFLGWFAWPWSSEQIRIYAAWTWGLETIWFVIGVFMPEARL